MTAVETLIARTERAIARAETRRVEVRSRHRVEVEEIDEGLRRLRSSLRVLKRQRDGRSTPRRTARVQAGPKAIGLVTGVLREGPLSMSEIVKRTGLNWGTVSYALTALREDGLAEDTGQTVAKSREVRLTAAGERAA